MTDSGTERRRRLIGVGMVLLALLTVVGVAFDQYQNRQTALCQARYNISFERTLQDRSSILDSDRRNLANLVKEVVNAQTRQDSRNALNAYLAAESNNDAKRAQNPLPALPSDPHC